MSQQVRPSNGTHAMIGHPPDPNHTFNAQGLVGTLDPGSQDEIWFAWDRKLKRYENGSKHIYFYAGPPKVYLYADLGVSPVIVETGDWT